VPENCTKESGAFTMNCTGRNAMTQRNWACDNIVWSYFGPSLLNASGEDGFKGALFQCMIAAALNMQTVVESHRGSNFYGTLEWQASSSTVGVVHACHHERGLQRVGSDAAVAACPSCSLTRSGRRVAGALSSTALLHRPAH
jgi:hypothetical protein